jgi:hypothetical protein
MTDSGTAGPGPAADDEVARLQAEIARLREDLPDAHGRRRGWWRPVLAGFLVAVAALLAPLSVLATWASGQIEDTDRYVATVGPLANDPDVQKAIAARAEQVIFSYLDLDAAMDQVAQALSDQGLPPRVAATLQAVSGPLASAIRSFVSDRILAFVQSDAFEQAWIEANRTAHSELVTALTGGGGGAVTVNNGAVKVNLAVVINTIKQQLSDAGFAIADRIPEVAASFTIVQSGNLETVQTLLGVLDNLSTWLPVLGLGLLAVAVLLARDRRRMVLASGIAVAASMLLLGATLNAIRPFYLNALPESSSAAAAGAIYDQLVSFIRLALRGLLVVALTVAVVAWLSARRGSGAAARGALVRGIDVVRVRMSRAGLQTGGFGVVLGQYRGSFRVGIVAIAALAYLAQDHPTGGTAVVFVVVTGLLVLVLELLATPPPPAATASGDVSEP